MYTPYMLVYPYTASGQIYNKLILMVASGEGALKTRDRDGNKPYTVQLFAAFKKIVFTMYNLVKT